MHSKDFRNKSYSINNLITSGKYSGNRFYYKLFVIENMIRIFIHTILENDNPTVLEWWDELVPNRLKKTWHSMSSHHGIYHIFLNDLNSLIIENRPLIEPYVDNLDDLILEIELFNDVRRKIAHTKFLNTNDIKKLDELYIKSKKIIDEISKKLVIEIP